MGGGFLETRRCFLCVFLTGCWSPVARRREKEKGAAGVGCRLEGRRASVCFVQKRRQSRRRRRRRRHRSRSTSSIGDRQTALCAHAQTHRARARKERMCAHASTPPPASADQGTHALRAHRPARSFAPPLPRPLSTHHPISPILAAARALLLAGVVRGVVDNDARALVGQLLLSVECC